MPQRGWHRRKADQVQAGFFAGKRILVTGGAGSIGSEIVRQLIRFRPEVVRVFGQDETQLFYLNDSLGEGLPLRFLVGDVRDRHRLARAMRDVDVVFHAAALKHVPSCEYNPYEAVQTNVIGTQNVIDAAVEAGVKKLVAISTDKAADARHVMGATKLLAEKLVSATAAFLRDLKPCCVRFGNVLGSRGSVVPLVMRQIERGGPVTLTDKGMTRFTMTIEDAVGLVLEVAARDYEGGEVFILKMPAMKVVHLIEALVKTYAPRVGRAPSRIPIRTIGARPGERMDEVLLSPEECARTEDVGPYLIVHPPFRLKKVWSRLKAPPPTVYVSSAAPQLDRDEIAALLERSGVMGGRERGEGK